MMNSPKTFALLEVRFPADLSNVVIMYMQSGKREYKLDANASGYDRLQSEKHKWKSIAKAGEYETCLDMPDLYMQDGFYGACRGGHIEIVKLLISRSANYWNVGLEAAYRGDHKEIGELMVAYGANKWNLGMVSACRTRGNKKLAKIMLSLNENEWSTRPAQIDMSQNESIEYMLTHCVSIWGWGNRPDPTLDPESNPKPDPKPDPKDEFHKYMLKHGASDWTCESEKESTCEGKASEGS